MPTIRVPLDRTFQLFRHDQDFRREPCARLSREDAQYLIDCGLAWRRSKYQVILKPATPLKLRGESCKITLETILKAISGSQAHKAMIEAWAA